MSNSSISQGLRKLADDLESSTDTDYLRVSIVIISEHKPGSKRRAIRVQNFLNDPNYTTESATNEVLVADLNAGVTKAIGKVYNAFLPLKG